MKNTVGIFDSGVGGLSVFLAIRELLPSHPLVYFADQAHVPYGTRELDEVRGFAHAVTQFLLSEGARMIVVACNTASVAALKSLRFAYPDVSFVGMEPAVKPAAEQTHSGVVGVLATAATFQTEMYASVVERFAHGVTILESPCPGLVNEIEKGNLEGAETRNILNQVLQPMLANGADTIVMGCTHYPFVIPLIRQIAGPNVQVIDPAPAIARQTRRMLAERELLNEGNELAEVRLITSGDAKEFHTRVKQLLGFNHSIEKVLWQDDTLVIQQPSK